MPKDIKFHKKQLREHRARNAFNNWAGRVLNEIHERVRSASDERWADLKRTLELRRCNLEAKPHVQHYLKMKAVVTLLESAMPKF